VAGAVAPSVRRGRPRLRRGTSVQRWARPAFTHRVHGRFLHEKRRGEEGRTAGDVGYFLLQRRRGRDTYVSHMVWERRQKLHARPTPRRAASACSS
jgi:hypothetical protein